LGALTRGGLAVAPAAATARTPVVILPGIMGSRLFNTVNGQEQEIWADVCHVVDSNLNMLALGPNGDSPLYPNDPAYATVHTKPGIPGILDRMRGSCYWLINLDDDYYDSIIQHFKGKGYTVGVDLFVFPYDWRKDLKKAANDLDVLINAIRAQTGQSQVFVVAHSMGGLVSRQYISDSARAAKVKKFVALGTPFLGTPKALHVLQDGDCMADLLVTCLPDPAVIRDLSANFPGFYELMPSQTYYTVKGGGFYGMSSNIDVTGKCAGCLSYNNTYVSTIAPNLNSRLVTTMTQFHTGIDNLTSWNGVPTYIVGGRNQSTIVGLRQYQQWSLWCFCYQTVREPIYTTAGDGTVAELSVSLSSSLTGKNLRGTASYAYIAEEHVALPRNQAVLDYVDSVLGLTAAPVPTWPTPPDADGFQLTAYRAAAIDVYDAQGNHVGVNPKTGVVEITIPGAAYAAHTGLVTVALVGGRGDYKVIVTPDGSGPLDVSLTRSVGEALVSRALYLGLSATEALALSGDPAKTEAFTNGLTPNATLDLAVEQETDAPSTAIGIEAVKGGYRVTLTASDVSGIARIEYGFEKGRPQVYTEPFFATAEQLATLHALALDNAGHWQTAPTTVEMK
jgi:pimeloyl-ACP methyl ester carboxylesterase